MRRILALVTIMVAALLVAACTATHIKTVTHTKTETVTTPAASSSPKAPAPSIKQPAATCPKGKSFMGCSTATSKTPPKLMLTPLPAGARFPDVSNYQGHPNWAAAKAWGLKGAVFKIGESSNYIDADASYNNSQLKALGIPHAGYWFVRPVGCAAEGAKLEAEGKALGLKLIVLDEEVSGLSGYAQCLNPYVKAATGHDAAVYRSSGNNFDSSQPSATCWVAAYGPSKTPACSGRAIKAWQESDGRYGFPVYIPGVGTGDVSIDFGLISMMNGPQPKPKPTNANCPAQAKAMKPVCLQRFPTNRVGPYKLNERNAMSTYKYRRAKSQPKHIVWLRNRVWFVAHHNKAKGKWVELKKPNWNWYRGYRYQRLARDAAGK